MMFVCVCVCDSSFRVEPRVEAVTVNVERYSHIKL